MFSRKRGWIGLGLGLALMLPACTNNGLDDGDSANVALEVLSLTNPPVTGSVTTGTCATSGDPCLDSTDCDTLSNESCVFDFGSEGCQVTEWSASLTNVPKSAGAELGSPFEDIALQSVTISYVWPSGFTNGPVPFPLSGTIEVGQTRAVSFFPITNEDLAALGAFLPPATAATGFLTMTIRGQSLDGEVVTVTTSEQLFVEACF